MLHALLHGKLEETIPEPQRLEDALTSVVFGTLVWLDAWDLLARWLGVPCDCSAEGGQLPSRECWFWPQMDSAEPDVVLRVGNALVVVEAKYKSGKHNLPAPNDDDERCCDQLVRQYNSITEPLSSRVRYADPIERAIRECQFIQVFVVDAGRLPGARIELEKSKQWLPKEASLQLVTWQSLSRMLISQGVSGQRWIVDLLAYLQRSGLDTFDGISRLLASSADFQTIHSWRSESGTAKSLFREAITLELSQATALQRWRMPNRTEGTTS